MSKDALPTPQQKVNARALVADLGYLPLAVKQAGAYLGQNRGLSLEAYRRRFGAKLCKTAHGVDAERTVARVWDVALQILEVEHPLAVEVLHTAAWLAPDDIPHSLLTPVDADPDDIAEAIGTLAATPPPGHHNARLTDSYVTAADRLHHLGHTARAIPLLETTLAERVRVLGDAHPDTLTSRDNLAAAREAAAAGQQANTATPATALDHQPPSDTAENSV
ncbi:MULTISPECIES: hypothetical protein [unclassified Streptomyces]|uniref:hypothetical protein n=1 Tax=unclassified Streptomyces TaxID=2593676 RepID=UPI0036C9A145